MNNILELSFFRILSESSHRDISTQEVAKSLDDFANYLIDISLTEQDYSMLFRYFSFGLIRLKSYRTPFREVEKKTYFYSLMKR